MKILIVDDEHIALSSLQRILKRRGYDQVELCHDPHQAIELVKSKDFDLVLLDLVMPGLDGLQVLERAKPYAPETEFVMLTAVDEIETVVKALRLGAYDYLVKPVDSDRLFLTIEHAFERRKLLAGLAVSSGRSGEKLSKNFAGIVSQCPRVLDLLLLAQTMAKSGNPVLITGESGTGKELLAKAIHLSGPKPDGPYVPVNVASVSEALFESQFFGHVKGAFTGANLDYPGFFEQAHGGTLFLDEIGELPLALQAKFLRVLEDKKVTRLGNPGPIVVDARIISATNVDLDRACQEGSFRLDLMYRLKSIHLHLPPLHEREGDIPLLAHHFLSIANKRHNRQIQGFSAQALAQLQEQSFPGNVRELGQQVENAVLVSTGDQIELSDLGITEEPVLRQGFGRQLCTLKEDSEIHTAYVLTQAKGDRQKTADILGVSLRQVQRKLADMKKQARWQYLFDDI